MLGFSAKTGNVQENQENWSPLASDLPQTSNNWSWASKGASLRAAASIKSLKASVIASPRMTVLLSTFLHKAGSGGALGWIWYSYHTATLYGGNGVSITLCKTRCCLQGRGGRNGSGSNCSVGEQWASEFSWFCCWLLVWFGTERGTVIVQKIKTPFKVDSFPEFGHVCLVNKHLLSTY